jgi:LAO/AO transport system kinase
MARALSRAADASVAEVLASARGSMGVCRRIGVTGPPGAGKSSLIAALARHRLGRNGNIAILAVDPTSPVSGGAILGDRIRMEDLVHNPRVYIRSLASRASHDGLADNLPDILEIVENAGFAEAILETVGVG